MVERSRVDRNSQELSRIVNSCEWANYLFVFFALLILHSSF